jgi:hypothetical protein
MRKTFRTLIAAAASLIALPVVAALADPQVVEVVTLKLKNGVSYADFAPIDKAVETQHVSKQPGFISRESAAGQNGEWLVVIHWRSAKDADASMASFASAPAAKDFMANIDASTLAMKRYTQP